MVTVVALLTAVVLTGNAPLDAPPLTTVSSGTCSTAGLLENSCTTAPFVAAVKRTVPVAALPPVSVDGVTETAFSDGPGGVAAFTDSSVVRGTFWIAAM